MRTRLKDVARALNLSISTVNAALRNRPDISEKTRRRVFKKAEELRYRPNWVASSLVTQRTHVLGVVVPDLSRSFFTEVMKGIDQAASAAGYHLVVCNTGENPVRETDEVSTLISKQVDGLIIASAHEPGDGSAWRELSKSGIPFVLIDRFFSNVSFVGGDDERIGFIATQHLIANGYRNIAHLRGPNISTAIGRYRGYLQGLREHRFRARHDFIVDAEYHSEASGYEGAKRLLQLRPCPDAIFAASDPIAIGAMQAIFEVGLRIPYDIGVIGVGNVRYGEYLRVPLSTVDQHREEIGRVAASMLLDLVNEKTTSRNSVLIVPSLVPRESTCRPALKQTSGRTPSLRTATEFLGNKNSLG